MLKIEQFDHIVLSLFSGEVTVDELEEYAEEIEKIAKKQHTLFLMALPIHVTSYPNRVSDVVKASRAMQASAAQVTRLYGIRINPIASFIAGVFSQLLKLKNNTVETNTLTEMFYVMDREADAFPELKQSLAKHGSSIRERISEFEESAV